MTACTHDLPQQSYFFSPAHLIYTLLTYCTLGPPGTPAGGAVYVRWGRKSCPNNTSLVYNGTAAGSHDGAGGTSDIFCMPEDPSYKHVVDSVGRSKTLLDNIRYETDEMFSSINEANVPCAVCQSETRSVALLQPGKTSCPEGWTEEYAGYLMADEYNNEPRSAICIDEAAEGAGNPNDRDRGLTSVMFASCDGLKCPPYNPNGLVTCTLCTK